MTVFILAVATALVVSFACSLFEAVLLSLGHAQVEGLRREGRIAGEILSRFRKHPDVPLAAILILNTIAHTIGASVAGATYGSVFDPSTLWIFSVIFTVAILIFTEIIPKTLGVAHNVRFAAPVAILVHGLTVVLHPILVVVRKLTRLLEPKEKAPVTSTDELRILAALGRDQGVLRPKVARIIEGASQLRSLMVRDVMLPRSSVVCLSEKLSLEENLDRVRSSGHSRFPLVPNLDLDEVSGIVLAKELAHELLDNSGSFRWSSVLRAPTFLPENAKLHDALAMFQKERRHLALVVDEYGGSSGIVTLEDVVEELVGEIWDETDHVESTGVVERPGGGFESRGDAYMRAVCEHLGISPEDPELGASNTLSGFLSDKLGRLPEQGDVVEHAGYRFRVVAATRRRAVRIAIDALPLAADGGD